MATYTSGAVDGNSSFKPFPSGTLGVRYERLIPVLIEAVKELTAKVKSLESNK